MMKDYSFTSLSCLLPHNSGLEGFQSTDSDVSLMMGSNINGYFGTEIDNSYPQQLSYENVDFPSQFSYFSPVMYSSLTSTTVENLSLASPPPLVDYQCSLPCDSNINTDSPLPHPSPLTMKDGRKNGYGAKLAQRSSVIGNITSCLEASNTSKKRKAIEQLIDARKLKAPVRRSQKLSDKITALQELVSPYGKTDTASVLQEACIYIKIIHQEIRRLSISYIEARSLHPQLQGGDEERQIDLGSRGLCLVPISIMKSLARDNWIDHHQPASRTTFRRPRC